MDGSRKLPFVGDPVSSAWEGNWLLALYRDVDVPPLSRRRLSLYPSDDVHPIGATDAPTQGAWREQPTTLACYLLTTGKAVL